MILDTSSYDLLSANTSYGLFPRWILGINPNDLGLDPQGVPG